MKSDTQPESPAAKPASASPRVRSGYLRVSLAPSSRKAFHQALARDGQDQARMLRRWVDAFVAGKDSELPVAAYSAPWPGASGATPSAYIQVLVDKPAEASFKARCKVLGVGYGKALRAWIEAHCSATSGTPPRTATAQPADCVPRIRFQIPASARDPFVALCKALGAHPLRATEAWVESMADGARAPRAAAPLPASRGSTRFVAVAVDSGRAALDKAAAEARGRDLKTEALIWMAACVEAGALVGLGGRRPTRLPPRASGATVEGRGARAASPARGSPTSVDGAARHGYFDAAVSSELKAAFVAQCALDDAAPAKLLRSWLCAFAAGDSAALPGGGNAPIDLGAGLDAHVQVRMPRPLLDGIHAKAGARGQELSKVVRGWMRAYADCANDGPAERVALDPAALGEPRAVRVDLPAGLLKSWRHKLVLEKSTMSKRGRDWALALVAGEHAKLPAEPSEMRASAIPRFDKMDATISIVMPAELRSAFARRCRELSMGQAQAMRMLIEADVARPTLAPRDHS